MTVDTTIIAGCHDISREGFICTLPKGHTSQHEARDGLGHVVDTWPVEKKEAVTMTTTSAITITTPPEPTPLPVVDIIEFYDSEGYLDRTKVQHDPRVVLAKKTAGTKTFAVYFELDRLKPDDSAARTVRVLLVSPEANTDGTTGRGYMVRQVKDDYKKAAKWKVLRFTNPIDATFDDITTAQVRLRGEPLLVQLTDVDIEALRKGEAPITRYAAKRRYEALYGAGA